MLSQGEEVLRDLLAEWCVPVAPPQPNPPGSAGEASAPDPALVGLGVGRRDGPVLPHRRTEVQQLRASLVLEMEVAQELQERLSATEEQLHEALHGEGRLWTTCECSSRRLGLARRQLRRLRLWRSLVRSVRSGEP